MSVFFVSYHVRGTRNYMEILVEAPDLETLTQVIDRKVPGFKTMGFKTRIHTLDEAAKFIATVAEIK